MQLSSLVTACSWLENVFCVQAVASEKIGTEPVPTYA